MVTLAFPESVYLKMVLVHYGWPLLAALAGAFAGYAVAGWFQFEAFLLDLLTLLGGILVGGMAVQMLRKLKTTETALNSLQMAVYYPSATPNMCSSGVNSQSNPDSI